jgi:bifunctional DNA-binding transcriptional regulator/antitoxin component of YhaV-PrlF toxin-antitoxin module
MDLHETIMLSNRNKGVNTMTIEYTGRILPDGHLPLPDEIRQSLGLKIGAPVKITLTLQYNPPKNIAEEVDFGELVAKGYQEMAEENLAFAKLSFEAQKEVIDAK